MFLRQKHVVNSLVKLAPGSTLFVYESSNILVDDKNIHFVIMRFKGL